MTRISHDLLEELTVDEIEETLPVRERMGRALVLGNVVGKATLDVEFAEVDGGAVFVIRASGRAHGGLCGCRGRFRAKGVVCAPFSVEQTVRFDGTRFALEQSEVYTRLSGRLTSLRTAGNGPLGTAISGAAKPILKGMVPRMARDATPIANRYLTDFVRKEADSVITELNTITPLEETVNELYPETKDWIYRLSTTETQMQIAYGPPDAVTPSLPASKKLPAGAGVEVWIKSTPQEARFLEALSTWNTAHDMLREYLADQPEVQKLIEDAKVTAVDHWVVISIGLHANGNRTRFSQSPQWSTLGR